MDIEKERSRAPIPFECEWCSETFYRPKNAAMRAINGTKKISCCSMSCARKNTEAKKEKRVLTILNCKKCDGKFEQKTCEIYCSTKCSNGDRVNMSQEQREKHRKSAIKYHKNNIPHPRTLIKYCDCKICGKKFISKRNSYRKTCSKECFSKNMSDLCKARPDMGKNNNKHARWYQSPIAGRVWLESSWEVNVAMILDKNNIKWLRPKNGFLWKDEAQKEHKYYPDFYLPNANIYLDPKNPWVWTRDLFKLNAVVEQHKIKLFILKKDDIKEERILKLIADNAL